MSDPFVQARSAGRRPAPELTRDPDIVAAYLDDASASGRGASPGLVRPDDEEEAAAFLRETAHSGQPVLPQAARSSLTGGAVPRGEVILSVERMTGIGAISGRESSPTVSVRPGVRLRDLQTSLADRGFYYPPVPTYQDAMIGGTVATNAGGAATFKYGVTRDWVQALHIVLFNGDLLVLERGEACARPGERFRIGLSDGRVLDVPVPDWRLPPVKKISAGYFASDPLDLVDLFVGSEGTLGLVTEVTLRLVRLPTAVVTGLLFLPGFEQALALAAELRNAGELARADASSPDVRAIESLDSGSLRLVRDHGAARRLRVRVPADAGAALLFEVELPARLAGADVDALFAERLFRLLRRHDVSDSLEVALPDDASRGRVLAELRESVPRRVHEVLEARRRDDPGISKVGGDLIVPFDELGAMVRIYEEGFRRRGLEFAIWGHVSDGNLHPNALPVTSAQAQLGRELMLEYADEAIRRGGCPLSEHGVGRSPLKQEILRRFLGAGAVEKMRAVKRALDPPGRFAPGVLFPPA